MYNKVNYSCIITDFLNIKLKKKFNIKILFILYKKI